MRIGPYGPESQGKYNKSAFERGEFGSADRTGRAGRAQLGRAGPSAPRNQGSPREQERVLRRLETWSSVSSCIFGLFM